MWTVRVEPSPASTPDPVLPNWCAFVGEEPLCTTLTTRPETFEKKAATLARPSASSRLARRRGELSPRPVPPVDAAQLEGRFAAWAREAERLYDARKNGAES